MILIPIFLILFACWMLWGWTVGESKNVKWLRCWCGPIFVVTVMLISAGAGAFITRTIVRRKIENDVAELLETIEQKISADQGQQVVAEIQATDHADDPDKDAFDLLNHLTIMQENLTPRTENIAEATNDSTVR